jgi:hypothetical protein
MAEDGGPGYRGLMGTGLKSDLHAPDGFPGRPPGPGLRGAAATGSQTAAAVPPRGLLPGMARLLDELRWTWGGAFTFGACLADREEIWTAARIDGLGSFWASSHDGLLTMVRAEYGRMPVPRSYAMESADRLLERCRARNPAWALVFDGEAYVARRGDEVRRAATTGQMDAELAWSRP